MTRLACLFAAILALAACDFFQPERQDWPEPSPALWEITGPEGQQGWLFGTVHALPDGVEWRTPVLQAALAESDVLVVEIADLSDTQQAATVFRALSTTPNLPPLTQRVPDQDRVIVRDLLKLSDMDESDFTNVETWAAALILADANSRSDTGNGVDKALIEGAADEVTGLETFDMQFGIFDRLPASDQADLLVSVGDEASSDTQDEFVEIWLTGDLARLESKAMDGMLGDEGLYEALLCDRNRQWVETIATLIERGEEPFVAVGAAHMLTDNGLPALLAQRGFAVERLQ